MPKVILKRPLHSSKRNDETTKVISLFTGIGGIDMGFGHQVIVHKNSISEDSFVEGPSEPEGFVRLKKLPFESVFQNDILKGAKETYEYNFKRSNYDTRSIFDILQLEHFAFPRAEVVLGGFPCNDFSHAGKRRGFQSEKSHDMKSKVELASGNSRGTLYKSFVEVVRRVQPKVFVAENVYGLLTMPNAIETIVGDFESIGYTVAYQDVYCPDYGIAQTRRRVIIMGVRRDSLPLEEGWNVLKKNRTTCCIGDYFAHLKEPSETEDCSQKSFSKAKRLRKGQGQKEVDLRSFAPTMRAEHHGNIEFRRLANSTLNPTEAHLPERRLTVREAGLIQTFPPAFVFSKKVTQRPYKYIGNAVPPLLGYLIADKVKSILKKYFR